MFSVDATLGSGYVQQWNASVQRRSSRQRARSRLCRFEITHVGIPDTNINQLTVEQLAQGPSLLKRVPNPYFGTHSALVLARRSDHHRRTAAEAVPRYTTVSLYRNNVGDTNDQGIEMSVDSA